MSETPELTVEALKSNPRVFIALLDQADADPALKAAIASDVNALLRQANEGNKSVAPVIRAWLEARPEQAMRILKGDPARWAEEALIEKFGRGNTAMPEAFARRLAGLRDELAGPDASPLERLLAERVAFCWGECYEHDWNDLAADKRSREVMEIKVSLIRRDRAHRRLLSSIQALAAIRRKPAAAVQVNVGSVNVELAGEDRSEGPDMLQLLGERPGFRN